MAFTNDPALARDRVRMKIGDVEPTNPLVDDVWYEYYLEQNNNNENLTAIDCAKAILAKYSNESREVIDQVEIFDNLRFEQYLEWLKKFISDPSISGLAAPEIYAGGISVSDMRANDANPDNKPAPTRVGFAQESDRFASTRFDTNPYDFRLK